MIIPFFWDCRTTSHVPKVFGGVKILTILSGTEKNFEDPGWCSLENLFKTMNNAAQGMNMVNRFPKGGGNYN